MDGLCGFLYFLCCFFPLVACWLASTFLFRIICFKFRDIDPGASGALKLGNSVTAAPSARGFQFEPGATPCNNIGSDRTSCVRVVFRQCGKSASWLSQSQHINQAAGKNSCNGHPKTAPDNNINRRLPIFFFSAPLRQEASGNYPPALLHAERLYWWKTCSCSLPGTSGGAMNALESCAKCPPVFIFLFYSRGVRLPGVCHASSIRRKLHAPQDGRLPFILIPQPARSPASPGLGLLNVFPRGLSWLRRNAQSCRRVCAGLVYDMPCVGAARAP